MRFRWMFVAMVLGVMSVAVPAGAAEFEVLQNLTYAEVGDVRLQLDLARPQEGDGPFPLLVFIHGGGWSGGNRIAYRRAIETAAQKGYVAATVSYRLTQPDKDTGVAKTPFPAQIHDCKAAIRWLKANAEKYNIDPDRVGVTGASAGGHLSLLVGLTSAEDGLEGELGNPDQSSRVQVVVNVYGPTDLVTLYRGTPGVVGLLKALCGGTPETAAENFRLASPITFITADDPPILTLHGDADRIVPVEQAEILDERLKAAGVPHVLKVFKEQGHGFQGESAIEAQTAMWDFFAKHLKP